MRTRSHCSPGPFHAVLVCTVSVSIMLSGCSKALAPGDSDLQHYADEINQANQKAVGDGGVQPQISEGVRMEANDKLPAAKKAVDDARSAAIEQFDKSKNKNDPLLKEARACTEIKVPEDASKQAQMTVFQDQVTKCKEVEKNLAGPGFGDDKKALQDFLKGLMVMAAIVAIAYGNYPLAAFLLNQALGQKGGEGGGNGSGTGTGATGGAAVTSPGKDDKQPPPPIDGFTRLLGSDVDGYSVNYSKASHQIILQPMTGVAIYLDIEAADFKKYLDGKDPTHCKVGVDSGAAGLVKLSLIGQSPCPNVSITTSFGKKTASVDSLSAPSIEQPAATQ